MQEWYTLKTRKNENSLMILLSFNSMNERIKYSSGMSNFFSEENSNCNLNNNSIEHMSQSQNELANSMNFVKINLKKSIFNSKNIRIIR
jgi:hypothetical protein